MSKMNAPKMEVVRFKEADVIVASGAKTLTLENFGNGVLGDGSLNFGNYTHTSNDVRYWNNTDLKDHMYDYFGYDFNADRDSKFFNGTHGFKAIASDAYGNSDTSSNSLNGTWEWDSSEKVFTKQ